MVSIKRAKLADLPIDHDVTPPLTIDAASRSYTPTREQVTTSPLLHALAAKGATETEVIEHLFRQVEEWKRIAGRFSGFLPVGPISVGGLTYTNPTADKMAEEGRRRTLEGLIVEARAQGVADERARLAPTLADLEEAMVAPGLEGRSLDARVNRAVDALRGGAPRKPVRLAKANASRSSARARPGQVAFEAWSEHVYKGRAYDISSWSELDDEARAEWEAVADAVRKNMIDWSDPRD